MDLSGTYAFVTGGSRGIGRGIAIALARAGGKVAIGYRAAEAEARAATEQIQAAGGSALAVPLDVRKMESCQAAWEKAQEHFDGKGNLLVNCAGIVRSRVLGLMSEEEWGEVLDTNLSGAFHMCRAAIRDFIASKSGNIINVSSVMALKGVAGQSNYSASKAGLIGFSRSLAREVASKRIRVNVIAPGYIETDMLKDIPEKGRAAALEQIPMGRFGTVEDVASMALFLASAGSAYVTGQVFVVDGGGSL
ncbi:MAG: 3-oxoacyl-ACP reductase FabG [Myxococcales bacterium]|nr:3-oxoacyl-ACP reductase FabG [Myxococcales bacterium]